MKLIDDYKDKTQSMNRQEKMEYTLTYYWYHMLGIVAVIGFILFLILHIKFGMQKPEFTCVLVNQEIDYERDERLAHEIAKELELKDEYVLVDSDFQISYENVKLTGINESSYEKFFFKWQNEEIDAVILPESFYHYCKKAGGTFKNVEELGAAGLSLYEDDGCYRAIYIEDTGLMEVLKSDRKEPLLLAFPDTGQHEEKCNRFITYITEIRKG